MNSEPLFRPGQFLRRPPPLLREVGSMWEWLDLARDPVWSHEDIEAAPPQAIALVPGFLAGDASLGPLTDWLRRGGHRTARVGIRANVGCSTALIDRLEVRVERMADQAGGPVTVLGQSRGGCIARGLAMRRPDLVSRLITLGSPHLDQLAVHPLVYLQVLGLGALGSLGVPGLFRDECFRGDCCVDFRQGTGEELPDGTRLVSIYSRTDGIVDWHACLAPGAELVEVPGTHSGMAINKHVYRVLARELAREQAGQAELV